MPKPSGGWGLARPAHQRLVAVEIIIIIKMQTVMRKENLSQDVPKHPVVVETQQPPRDRVSLSKFSLLQGEATQQGNTRPSSLFLPLPSIA